MFKWFKNLLGLVIIAFLLWYLYEHWHEVKALLNLNVFELAIIYFVCLMGILDGALVVMAILRPMGAKVLFLDMVLLQNAGILLNYVPMKFGTIFMANYLKRHYNLKYSYYGTFALYLMLILATVASSIGIVVMVFVYGLGDYQRQILTAIFLASLLGALFALCSVADSERFVETGGSLKGFSYRPRDSCVECKGSVVGGGFVFFKFCSYGSQACGYLSQYGCIYSSCWVSCPWRAGLYYDVCQYNPWCIGCSRGGTRGRCCRIGCTAGGGRHCRHNRQSNCLELGVCGRWSVCRLVVA